MVQILALLAVVPALALGAAIETRQTSSYLGCYQESGPATGIRSLPSASFFNYTAMTVEMCASDCSAFVYYGVEYGGECYCANSISTGSTLDPVAADCSMACPGNSSEVCGGPDRLNIYKNLNVVVPTTSTAPSGPSVTGTKVGNYAPIGCYAEPAGGRALSFSAANDSMTVEMCAADCGGAYQYFGVEYGRECYCGNSIALATPTTTSSCNMLCSGNANEICGAGNTLSVYNSTIPIKLPPVPAPPAVIGGFYYSSCYTDGINGTRTLDTFPLANFTGMTNEMCATACAGFTYFGTEYGGECHCGNTLNGGSVTPATDCSMICPGNALEVCGNGLRLTLYSTTPPAGSSPKPSSVVSSSTSSSVKPTSSSTSSSVKVTSTSSSSSVKPTSSSSSVKPTSTSSSSSVKPTSTSSLSSVKPTSTSSSVKSTSTSSVKTTTSSVRSTSTSSVHPSSTSSSKSSSSSHSTTTLKTSTMSKTSSSTHTTSTATK